MDDSLANIVSIIGVEGHDMIQILVQMILHVIIGSCLCLYDDICGECGGLALINTMNVMVRVQMI